MVPHNMMANRATSKGDSYFVNSGNEMMDDMQKESNSDTENESNVIPERSNMENRRKITSYQL